MTTEAAQLLTPEEVAQRINMSRAWVLRRIAIWEKDRSDPLGLPAIDLTGPREGPGRRVLRIDPAVLAKWLETRAA